MKRISMAAASGLVLSLFLAVPAFAQGSNPTPSGDRVDANGMPTTHSTPAEQAQTAALNGQVQSNNAAADAQSGANKAQYQQSQQQYQGQVQQYQNQANRSQAANDQYQADRAHYDHQVMRYHDLRARYAAETRAYHRGIWPDRYMHWELAEYYPGIVGQRVEIVNGDRVGTVTDVSRTPNGRVEALLVELDRGKSVWIDRGDIRYDRADGVVMTNLDRGDLHQMADARL